MTRAELLRLYDIKLKILEETTLERELIVNLWGFYIDTGNVKANRYIKQLDKLLNEIFGLSDELALIRNKLIELED